MSKASEWADGLKALKEYDTTRPSFKSGPLDIIVTDDGLAASISALDRPIPSSVLLDAARWIFDTFSKTL